MNSQRRTFAIRAGWFAAAVAMIFAGSSLNIGGRAGWEAFGAVVAGALALAAGLIYAHWRVAVPLAAASLVVTLVIAQFNPMQGDVLVQLAGLITLGVGGVLGGVA